MKHLIDKAAVLAEIENIMKHYIERDDFDNGWNFALNKVLSFLDTLEGKEVDLELITGWFDHIAQIADDRMTLTNQRMTDAHALDEIKCLAKNSSEFITKHYKAQKGE